MTYSLPQLRAFVTLADERSFTRAAKRLHLSQPALTVQIRNLESSFGMKLFDRDPRGVALTSVGGELAPRLRRLLSDLDGAMSEARDIAKGRRGTIRIAALPSFSAAGLPDVVARFRTANPAIAFVIRDAIASKVVALVQSEAVDLGVTAGVELTPDVEILHEAKDRLCVVFPRRHPLASRRKITLPDLADFPLVLMDPETSVRAIVDAAFVSSGRIIRPAAEATYMMTAVGLVRAGLGITILPASSKEIDAAPDLRARPIDDARFSRTISLVKRRKRTLPPVCEEFLRELIGAMRPVDR
ncbi:LysR family transcriptional regulator [Methylocapsa sp. S129]|uniref:LysR family transcriptional regulator n=1 Tax=Methylocapsa sp. S129 TaxID=1641869 RepID=UPI00131A9289|nr:LysR family transcriptional regulator [Methylocapsa sp. S129]